jgi:hypothetical protein
MDNNKQPKRTYRQPLDEAAHRAKGVSLRRFRKEATAAWWRANPHGSRQQIKPMSPYNAFVREHMPRVLQSEPGMTRADAMRAVGEMWRAHKHQQLLAELDF